MTPYITICITAILGIIGLVWKTKKDDKPGYFNLLTPFGVLVLVLIITGLGFSLWAQYDKDVKTANKAMIDSLNARHAFITDSLGHQKTIAKLEEEAKVNRKKIHDDSIRFGITLFNFSSQLKKQKDILDTSTLILNDSKHLFKLQNQSHKVLTSQIDSASKMLALAKELLKYFNNDDSLVIVHTTRSDNYLVFEALNLSDYPAQNVVVTYPNLPFVDSVLQIKQRTGDQSLTGVESDNWRKTAVLLIDGRRSAEIFRVKVTEFNKPHEYFLDVKWSNRHIRYVYSIVFPPDSNSWTMLSQNHYDFNKRKYFTLSPDFTPIYK